VSVPTKVVQPLIMRGFRNLLRKRIAFAGLVVALAALLVEHCVPAQAAATRWKLAGSDTSYRVLQNHITASESTVGRHSEYWKVHATNGTYLYVLKEVATARVIDELIPSIWVKSDRGGLQILVRVVFPRSLDPATGLPVKALVRGGLYDKPGSWQQVAATELPKLVDRELRVVRSRMRLPIDGREAFVDAVLLNIYGGPGETNVWIDEIGMQGAVAVAPTGRAATARTVPHRSDLLASQNPRISRPSNPAERNVVDARGGIVTIDQAPFFSRALRHQGEPFEEIAAAQFNTVWLGNPPTQQQLDDAATYGLWIVAPPPGEAILHRYRDVFNRVLAWDIGRDASGRNVAAIRQTAASVRRADSQLRRPLVVSPVAALTNYSRISDILLLNESPPQGTKELSETSKNLGHRQLLARSGTPVWSSVATNPDEQLLDQIGAAANVRPDAIGIQSELIRMHALASAVANVRGLVFESVGRLDANDPANRLRSAMVELVNMELQWLSPWLAAPSVVSAASCSDPQTAATVVSTDRGMLVIALPLSPERTNGQGLCIRLPFLPWKETKFSAPGSGLPCHFSSAGLCSHKSMCEAAPGQKICSTLRALAG